MPQKILLIGWDAADWKTIDRLVDQGDMPIMKGLIEQGTRGKPHDPASGALTDAVDLDRHRQGVGGRG